MNDQQANALFEQSISLLQQAKPKEALKILAKLDQAIPSNPGILFFTASSYSVAGNKRKAIQTYERVIRLHPQFIEAYNNIALDLAYLGEHRAAITHLDQALKIRPDFIEAINNKGCFLNAIGEHQHAQACFETAIRINPSDTIALANLSIALIHLGQYSAAQAHSEKLISINPKDYKGYSNLGKISQRQDQSEQALRYFIDAHKANPSDIDTLADLATSYSTLGQYTQATIHFENALVINPEHGASHLGLGLMYHDLREFDKAIKHFSAPTDDKYRITLREYNRALSNLHSGSLTLGWTDYAWRWKEIDLPIPYLQTKQPVWDGQKTTDPVLIWHEQGLGDQLLFGTLLAETIERAPSLTVRVDARLIPLFRRSFANVNFVQHDHQFTDKDFKFHLPLGDLPRLFRNDLNDFEKQPKAYVKANIKRADSFQSTLGSEKLKIGLSWATQGRRSNDRNLPIDEIISVVNGSFASEFVDLQYSDTSLDRERIEKTQGIQIQHLDAVDNFNDLDSLASLIEACDFIITCSNSTAHLAGSLGKETYVLVPFGRGRHWYWSHIRNDGKSMWYPSVNVIPQTVQGDWSAAISALENHLKNRTKSNQ